MKQPGSASESAPNPIKPEVVGRIICAAVNNDTVVLVNTSSFLQCLPPSSTSLGVLSWRKEREALAQVQLFIGWGSLPD